ncbi:hypothetical protein OROHE_023174 [Orobanche hederae]
MTSVCHNAKRKPKPGDRTTHEAEIIGKLVCEIESSRNLDSALVSANLDDCVSPNLVLEKKCFQHSPKCYNALIESMGKIKQFEIVWLLVDEMKSKGLIGKDTLALVCRRYARADNVKEAMEAFEKMENKYGLKPKLQDYNRLLDTLSKSRHIEKAQEVFDKWKNTMFTPNIKLYTILLEGGGQECDFLRLNEVCREMREDGFEPDVVSYGILIKVYCKDKKFDEAIELYHKMEKENIEATPPIYCTLINAFGSGRKLDDAIKLIWR